MSRILKLTLLPCLLLAAAAVAPPARAQQRTAVTLLHFSDYHSHAVPFYSEGQADTAGVARLIAYLQPYANDPNSLIFNGGDMMNLGSPAWSDKFRCEEWPWFNGIVDVMAYGNHDSDYGPQVFADCRAAIDYPIISSNILGADGRPLFEEDGKTYKVFEVGGAKIGVFALAGPDFERLIRADLRPAAGATFADRVATARQVVAALRDQERVGAVVLIGHALREDDIALAQAVPGIDIIFGTHSHRKEELMQIPGTKTWMISPFQYATYVSKLELQFADGALAGVTGGLARIGADLQPEPRIVQRVTELQAQLEADPQYAALFQPIGVSNVELGTDGQFTGEALLGDYVLDIVRGATGAHLMLATASGFREPIPPGTITEERFRTAIPYRNRVLLYIMTGAQIQSLLDYSISRAGSDFFSQVSGVRFAIVDGRAAEVEVLRNPADPSGGYAALDPAATYTVATTDFQGRVAGGYKELFAPASYRDAGIDDIRDLVRAHIRSNSPVTAALDGRIRSGPSAPAAQPGQPAQLPNTAAPDEPSLAVVLLAGLMAAAGLWASRRARRS